MEGKQEGIFRLFIIITFFCFSIFFLNNNKKKFVTATHIDVCNVKGDWIPTISLEQAYYELSALFCSHDIDLMIKMLCQFKYNFTYELVEKMIRDTSPCILPAEKTTIICAMVAHYACPKKNIQYDFFDFFLKYPHLTSFAPLLSLARSAYADSIPLFIAWGKDRQKSHNRMGILAKYADQAFTRAIEEDDRNAVEILFSKKVRLSQAVASELLWYIVDNMKDNKLIALLIDHAQADVNYVRDGKTLLIAAVEKNNIDIVRILLDKGAVVDRTIDGEKGTALTIAMKYKYQMVEQLLREYGA